MAGLAAAWKLTQRGFHVTVLEKGSKPGLAAHSIDLGEVLSHAPNGIAGDVPSRMFNQSLWPSVCQLYQDAGVAFEPVDHQQTFCLEDEVMLRVGLPYRFVSNVNSMLGSRSRRVLQSISRFREIGLDALGTGQFSDATFGEFVESAQRSEDDCAMLEGFLFPALTSTVFTCPRTELKQFPCELVLQALAKITDQQMPLLRTVHGSHDAAEKLLNGVAEVEYETTVDEVCASNDSAEIVVGGTRRKFDHVIVATQANHASRLVANALPAVGRLLDRFNYVDVPVVLHTDESVLPGKRSQWSTFNFNSRSGQSACTVWMNRFHKQWPETASVFHSIFPIKEIHPEKVVAAVRMQRPVVDMQTTTLHRELSKYHASDRRVWFAGSYAVPGVPLLESAAASSEAVVSRLCSIQADVVAG